MRKSLTLSILLLSVVFLSACSKNNNVTKELSPVNDEAVTNDIENSSETSTSATKNEGTGQAWQSLKNNNYFFEFRHPADPIKEEEILPDSYTMSMKSKDGTYFLNVIAILNFNEEWKATATDDPICTNAGVTCEVVKINNSINANKITVDSAKTVSYHFVYKRSFYTVQHSVGSLGEEIMKTFILF